MQKLLREPLLHFVLLGGLLFAAYGFLNREPAPAPQEIAVTAGRIEHLITTFSRTWQRPPTPEEAQGLVDQFVREEIFSREAVKLGLDRDDTVIRRRLQQKMEFVSDDLSSSEEPTEAALAEYLAQHAEDFRAADRITFRQLFLSADNRDGRLESDAAALLAELRARGAGADVVGMGDPTLLPAALSDESVRRVEDAFGGEFVAGLADAPSGEWFGPIASAFGLHLVWVEARREGDLPDLAEVRDTVRREWENARRVEVRRRFYEELRKRYRITVEWPDAAGDGRTAAR